jgi:hypothetical protein
MGFLRKAIIRGTGGLVPINSRSYRQRIAEATERLAQLQEQQVNGATPPSPAPTAAVRMWKEGPRDSWLNEVGVALGEHGFEPHSRNTDPVLGGAVVEGNIGFIGPYKGRVWVNLFATAALAHQAEIGLRAKPEVRNALKGGFTLITTIGRVLFLAIGPGRPLHPAYLNEAIAIVGRMTLPPAVASDPVEQIRKLGELRQAGIVTEKEFKAKKLELLERV